MAPTRAQAIAILGSTTSDKYGNTHVVKPFNQPFISNIPQKASGLSQRFAISTIQRPVSTVGDTAGSSQPLPTVKPRLPANVDAAPLTCSIFMSHWPIKEVVDKAQGKVELPMGIVIEAMGNEVKLGPYFGVLNFSADAKEFQVTFENDGRKGNPPQLLTGYIKVTLQEPTSNRYKVEGRFSGRLSGETGFQDDVEPMYAKN